MQRAIQYHSNFLWNQLGMQRPGKIEKPRDQRAQTIGLTRDVTGQFAGQRIRFPQLLVQHLRRPFDHSQRIANLVCEPGGHLPQSRQPLRTPRLFLSLLQLAIGLGQRFANS